MLIKLLNKLGFADADEAVEFVITGLATLPALLMLGGFVAAGAIALLVMILLLAGLGISIDPVEVRSERDKHHPHDR